MNLVLGCSLINNHEEFVKGEVRSDPKVQIAEVEISMLDFVSVSLF